jgi:uncharacterized membrane protein
MDDTLLQIEPLPPPTPEKDVEQNKDLAALSYLWVMSVVVYFLKAKESAFVRYHSRQAIILFILSIIFWFIPFIGQFLELIILVGIIIGFAGAAQGQWKSIPIAGPLSRREITVREAWKQVIDVIAGFVKGLRASKNKDPEKRAP